MSTSDSSEAFVDYYALLGVAPDAGISQIRRAYLGMAKEHHPDAGGSTEKMQSLNTAYRTLMVATSRAGYDMLHSFHTGTSTGKYREEHEDAKTGSAKGMSDEYVDFFIDSVFAEYHQVVPQKTPIAKRIKQFFQSAK